MVRSSHKTKILFAAMLAFSAPALILSSAKAANPESVLFQVNIAEALTLVVTDPTDWASGELNHASGSNMESDFLRNKVNVAAYTNNPIGVTVSMYTKDDTDLRNTASYNSSDATSYIPTLASAATPGTNGASFPVNYWGYSVDDTDTLNTSATYNALRTSTNPIQLFQTSIDGDNCTISQATHCNNKDVFFGAKANNTKQSGTYTRTVYFAAVTGTIDTDNPIVPNTPSTPDPINNAAHYSSTTGQTTYTERSTTGSGSSATDTTSTDVTKGDISTTYAQAYGVTSTSNGSALATAFGVAAGVAATSGIAFFVAAKRRKDDENEEG